MADNNVSAHDFTYIANLLRNQSGLIITTGKEYLVKARLAPLAHKHRLHSISQLVDKLRTGNAIELVNEVVEAMLTTETSFFRDSHPFEALCQTVLPKLLELRRIERQLNIWCAASSSGQEPYSVAILLKENFPELANWKINLTATDISQEMLERSRAGRYSQLEVNRGLPPQLLEKWFRKDGSLWQIDDRIRSTITFSQINLAQPWPRMPTWDLVLLRNVMIYFDNDVKKNILGRVSRVLSKDGYLVLGGAETTLSLDDSYRRIENLKSGFYQLKPTS